MDERVTPGQKEYKSRGLATIFGAPLSWVALFGGLIGALSIVPLVFYIFGGGYASAGMLIFAPLAGLILGPWAGLVAGIIGGLIGMFIAPGSYPLGLIDVFLSGGLLPLIWGLAHPRYRKIYVPVVVVMIIWMGVMPYYWPGPSGGFEQADPAYLISYAWAPVGLVVYLALQRQALRWIFSGMVGKGILGFFVYNFGPLTAWLMIWENPYNIMLKFPLEVARWQSINTWWAYIPFMLIAMSLVSILLVRAIRRSGLEVVPGSILDPTGVENLIESE